MYVISSCVGADFGDLIVTAATVIPLPDPTVWRSPSQMLQIPCGPEAVALRPLHVSMIDRMGDSLYDVIRSSATPKTIELFFAILADFSAISSDECDFMRRCGWGNRISEIIALSRSSTSTYASGGGGISSDDSDDLEDGVGGGGVQMNPMSVL